MLPPSLLISGAHPSRSEDQNPMGLGNPVHQQYTRILGSKYLLSYAFDETPLYTHKLGFNSTYIMAIRNI